MGKEELERMKKDLKRCVGKMVKVKYLEYGKECIMEGVLEDVNEIGIKLDSFEYLIPFEGWGIGIVSVVQEVYKNPSLSLYFDELSHIKVEKLKL
jgi:hypothetical protein